MPETRKKETYITDERIRNTVILRIRKRYGINMAPLFDVGLVSFDTAKKWLVYSLYWERVKKNPKKTYFDIKQELSVEFDISVSLIEKLVYKNNGFTE